MNPNLAFRQARWLFGLVCAFLWGATDTALAALTEPQQACLAKAWRHEKHGWVFVHVEGTARERGFQHGYLLAGEIVECLRVQRALWHHDSALDWPWLVEKAKAMYEAQIDPETLEELDGLVEGLGAAGVSSSRAEMIAYNAYFELAWYWWPQHKKTLDASVLPPPRQGCSSFIATGSSTADRGVVLGHNSMVDYPEATANVVMDIAPQSGHRILWQTWPGWLHSGTDFFVTDAGLVGSETTIGGFQPYDEKGVPEFVRMRRATQDASSIDEWCAILKRGNTGGYANAWLLGNVNSGEIARLELGLKRVSFERKRDGWFLGSNIAENLGLLRYETDSNENDMRQSNIARRARWKNLMGAHAGKIDLALAKRFEADHFDSWLGKTVPDGRTLCGHNELEPNPFGAWPGAPFYPAGTFDGKVVDASMAKQMSFAARWGAACGHAFNADKFLAAHTQFDWMRGLLKSRPSQPWTVFRAGEKR